MFGERLKTLRNEKKLRQEDVAKKIGIARTTYAMYEQEKREPDNDTLQKLANFYEVSVDFLLGRTNDSSHAGKKDQIHEIDDPKLNIFFKDFASAPDEKRHQLMDIWEVIKKDQATRKPGDKQGE